MICKNCKAEIRDGSGFCEHCGLKVEEKPSRFCSYCGAKLLPDSDICSECGKRTLLNVLTEVDTHSETDKGKESYGSYDNSNSKGKPKKIVFIAVATVVVVAALAIAIPVLLNQVKFRDANAFMQSGSYQDAYNELAMLQGKGDDVSKEAEELFDKQLADRNYQIIVKTIALLPEKSKYIHAQKYFDQLLSEKDYTRLMEALPLLQSDVQNSDTPYRLIMDMLLADDDFSRANKFLDDVVKTKGPMIFDGVCAAFVSKAETEGNEAFAAKNYEKAIEILSWAFNREMSSEESKKHLYQASLEMKDYESAQSVLRKLIEKDPANSEYRDAFINIQFETKQSTPVLRQAIEDAYAATSNEKYHRLLIEKIPNMPTFSVAGGTYDKYQYVEMTAENGENIYYTIDGSEPMLESDIYSGAIKLLEGKTTLKAITINQYGIKSDISVSDYTIKPINDLLYDLVPFVQTGKEPHKWERTKDNLGNTYSSGWLFTTDYAAVSTFKYLINGKYDRIKGKIATAYETKDCLEPVYYGIISIKGDGKTLYTSKEMRGGVKPIEFSIDISGVQELVIEAKYDNYMYSTYMSFGLLETVLTANPEPSLIPASYKANMVAQTQRVYDSAKLFSAEQIRVLEDKIKVICELSKMDVVIVTTNDTQGKTSKVYADDFYDKNGFVTGDKKSGVLFLIDMDNREAYISTCGDVINILTDDRIKSILDSAIPGLKSGNYADAADAFISGFSRYFY